MFKYKLFSVAVVLVMIVQIGMPIGGPQENLVPTLVKESPSVAVTMAPAQTTIQKDAEVQKKAELGKKVEKKKSHKKAWVIGAIAAGGVAGAVAFLASSKNKKQAPRGEAPRGGTSVPRHTALAPIPEETQEELSAAGGVEGGGVLPAAPVPPQGPLVDEEPVKEPEGAAAVEESSPLVGIVQGQPDEGSLWAQMHEAMSEGGEPVAVQPQKPVVPLSHIGKPQPQQTHAQLVKQVVTVATPSPVFTLQQPQKPSVIAKSESPKSPRKSPKKWQELQREIPDFSTAVEPAKKKKLPRAVAEQTKPVLDETAIQRQRALQVLLAGVDEALTVCAVNSSFDELGKTIDAFKQQGDPVIVAAEVWKIPLESLPMPKVLPFGVHDRRDTLLFRRDTLLLMLKNRLGRSRVCLEKIKVGSEAGVRKSMFEKIRELQRRYNAIVSKLVDDELTDYTKMTLNLIPDEWLRGYPGWLSQESLDEAHSRLDRLKNRFNQIDGYWVTLRARINAISNELVQDDRTLTPMEKFNAAYEQVVESRRKKLLAWQQKLQKISSMAQAAEAAREQQEKTIAQRAEAASVVDEIGNLCLDQVFKPIDQAPWACLKGSDEPEWLTPENLKQTGESLLDIEGRLARAERNLNKIREIASGDVYQPFQADLDKLFNLYVTEVVKPKRAEYDSLMQQYERLKATFAVKKQKRRSRDDISRRVSRLPRRHEAPV